jgi:integrase
MATIVKNLNKNGSATYKAKVRRLGYPTFTATFPSRAAPEVTLTNILTRYRDEVTPTHRGGELQALRITRFLSDSPMTKLPMSKITTSVLTSLRDTRLKQVSPGIVLRDIRPLRAPTNRARKEWDVQIQYPFVRLTKPKAPLGRSRRIDAEEQTLRYRGCEKSRNKYLQPAIEFALHTAMRQGEIVRLERRHTDFAKRTALLPMTRNDQQVDHLTERRVSLGAESEN